MVKTFVAAESLLFHFNYTIRLDEAPQKFGWLEQEVNCEEE